MAAKINNFPSYVVYDQSYKQSVSYTATANGSPAGTVTGTTQNIIDKNLTTSYKVSVVGDAPTIVDVIIDYGQIFWNTQIYVSHITVAGAAGYFAYSADGVNYTNLATGSLNETTSYLVMAFRFLKWHGESAVGALVYADIYECRLMGS